jgi:Inner membrane protein YqiJ, N-terminal/Inner membrane protein YqiJ, OB-fold
MDLLSAPNAPFLVAVALMIVIGALEGLSLIVGTGLSHHLDHLFGAHLDVDHPGVLGWLHIGRAPILVLLVIFLMAFAISGLVLQWALNGVTGYPLPAWIASIFAAACALPVVRGLGGLIARAIPRDETTAVSEDSFVGRVARLTGESASEGRPAQAKLTDEHGQSHYFLVEPDAADVTFARGETILVVRRASSSLFKAIRNPRPDLL